MFPHAKIEIVIWVVEHVVCFISDFVFTGGRRVVYFFLAFDEQKRDTWGAVTLREEEKG